MKIFGLETGIGPKPTYLSAKMACQFNQVFLAMFEAFSEKKPVTCTSGFGFENLNCPMVGFVASSRVRKWLQFWQLITAEKKDKTFLVKPTQMGWDAYKKGATLKMDVNGTNSLEIGVGKPYGTFDNYWKEISVLADAQCTKATTANWEYEFQKKYLEAWIGTIEEKAKPEILKWIREKIAAAPKRKKFGGTKKLVLDKSQKTLLDCVKKPEKKKAKKRK